MGSASFILVALLPFIFWTAIIILIIAFIVRRSRKKSKSGQYLASELEEVKSRLKVVEKKLK